METLNYGQSTTAISKYYIILCILILLPQKSFCFLFHLSLFFIHHCFLSTFSQIFLLLFIFLSFSTAVFIFFFFYSSLSYSSYVFHISPIFDFENVRYNHLHFYFCTSEFSIFQRRCSYLFLIHFSFFFNSLRFH